MDQSKKLSNPYRPPRLIAVGIFALAVHLAGCEVSDEQLPGHSAASPAIATVHAPLAAQNVSRAADSIHFVEGFQRGYDQAAAQGKPMLVFFTGRWCRFCQQMAAEALVDPQVVQLSERFVCILVEADDEPRVCEQFQVRSYPTVQFLSARGAPLQRVVGKTAAPDLARQMHAALDAIARAEDREEALR